MSGTRRSLSVASQVRSLPAVLLELAVVIIEVESDVTVLLLHKDSVRSVTIKRDLVQNGEEERGRHTGLTEG